MDISTTIAANLKALRRQRGLTLDAASEKTGVSRSMLSQIEGGKINPTVNVLWKITEGFNIPFSALVEVQDSFSTRFVSSDDVLTVHQNETVLDHIIFPYDEHAGFEIHYMDILPGGYHQSSPHIPGTIEYITLFTGTLRIMVGQEGYTLHPGDSLRFSGDVPHSYECIGTEPAKYHSVMYYSK